MEKTQLRHVKTGKVIWATAQWIKLTQEMKQMHLWERIDATQEVAKLKFEVPGVMAANEPAHEVVDVEPASEAPSEAPSEPAGEVEPAAEAANETVEFQDDVVEEKPKKSNKK